ncbi:MAG: cyclophilin-like fold protein [Faecalibacterium sp.]|nr:cyclophilin-like fold protein [Ruminococcus sp.]MCM1391578.1 cyclophilin-like fold protein [Ruminococcus sp.]MCM1485135.1 cyclophilin-like fold protein [Faecalibacterium sp.]
MENMVYAYINDVKVKILPENNSSAAAFVELLSKDDLVIKMHDYANFEKVGSLETTLPTNDKRITVQAGDVILYQGNSITIYYDTNTWNFTRLGKIQNLSNDELVKLLGDGDVTVKFSLN